MDQYTAYAIYRSWGWSQIEAAWAAVHGPAPYSGPTSEPEAEAEPSEPTPEPEAEAEP